MSTKSEVLPVNSRHKQLAKRHKKRETDEEWRETHKRDKRRKEERETKNKRKVKTENKTKKTEKTDTGSFVREYGNRWIRANKIN